MTRRTFFLKQNQKTLILTTEKYASGALTTEKYTSGALNNK